MNRGLEKINGGTETAVYAIEASPVAPNTMKIISYLQTNGGQVGVVLTLVTTLGMAVRYLGELWISPLTHQSTLTALLGFILLLIALSLWSPQEAEPPRLGLLMVILWSLVVAVSGTGLEESTSLARMESALLVCALWALFATRHTSSDHREQSHA